MTITAERVRAIATAYTAAWNTGRPAAVAGFFLPDGMIAINDGPPWKGKAGVAEMAKGFFADIPDLLLKCDGARLSGRHAVYLWTFTGTHAPTGAQVRVSGWEEWDLDDSGLIASSRGWFDAEDYERQTATGAGGGEANA